MYALRVCDLRALNESLLALNVDDASATFSSRLERALCSLIPCEFAAVERFDSTATWKERLLGDREGLIERVFPAFLKLGGTHPLFAPFLNGDLYNCPLRISDMTTQAALRNSPIYAEFLHPLRVDKQIAMAIPFVNGASEIVILSRRGLDFNEADRERFRAFLPHLVLSRRRSEHFHRRSEEPERGSQVLLQQRLKLTSREAGIVCWLARGKTDEDIAQICSITKRTVQKHCENIYRKLGVEGRTATVIKALEQS